MMAHRLSIEVVKCYRQSPQAIAAQNQGACPARNTCGPQSAPWVVFFLTVTTNCAGGRNPFTNGARRPQKYRRLMFPHIYDTGVLSPDPPLSDQVWDYEQYIRFVSLTWQAHGHA
jgi:hypothetical protein